MRSRRRGHGGDVDVAMAWRMRRRRFGLGVALARLWRGSGIENEGAVDLRSALDNGGRRFGLGVALAWLWPGERGWLWPGERGDGDLALARLWRGSGMEDEGAVDLRSALDNGGTSIWRWRASGVSVAWRMR